MKYKVRIDEHCFEVEIADLNARPVIATVDGEQFEVWPESDPEAAAAASGNGSGSMLSQARLHSVPVKASTGASNGTNGGGSSKTVRAPIPGVIVSIAVQSQAEVMAGQELCVLEAMKMKNSIRAARSGKIAEIIVSVGQHVKHHEVLMEYAG
jgi:biotin carboxyl carrier protein